MVLIMHILCIRIIILCIQQFWGIETKTILKYNTYRLCHVTLSGKRRSILGAVPGMCRYGEQVCQCADLHREQWVWVLRHMPPVCVALKNAFLCCVLTPQSTSPC